MPKRPIVRRRGKGTSVYKVHSFRHLAPLRLPKENNIKAKVVDILHSPGKFAPVAKLQLENGKVCYVAAVEGMYTGQSIEISENAEPKKCNILPLKEIPEGSEICFIERCFGDGGKFCRSSGAFGILKSKDEKYAYVVLRSRKVKKIPLSSRAIIGRVAGFGRDAKPIVKAGIKYHIMRARGRYWPIVSKSKMNPCDHKFGGSTRPGIPTSAPRNAPPGAKVGHIAPKRTGRKKK